MLHVISLWLVFSRYSMVKFPLPLLSLSKLHPQRCFVPPVLAQRPVNTHVGPRGRPADLPLCSSKRPVRICPISPGNTVGPFHHSWLASSGNLSNSSSSTTGSPFLFLSFARSAIYLFTFLLISLFIVAINLQAPSVRSCSVHGRNVLIISLI